MVMNKFSCDICVFPPRRCFWLICNSHYCHPAAQSADLSYISKYYQYTAVITVYGTVARVWEPDFIHVRNAVCSPLCCSMFLKLTRANCECNI